MASIPNLNTLRTGRRGIRLRGGGRGRGGLSSSDGASEDQSRATRDKVVQQTDHDATSSRMSAIDLQYLDDDFAKHLWPAGESVPKRYPIINRGTYVRTKAIDRLVALFLKSHPKQRKQIVSLGAGSDTRFFRFYHTQVFTDAGVDFHELDFEANVNHKRQLIRTSPLSSLVATAEKTNCTYHLHAIDLRDLTKKSPPSIPHLNPDLPTLILSECCLCYLPPEEAEAVIQYFTMHIKTDLALILYEPIRPFTAFGKTMVSNLASRGIHLQTLQRYSTLEAQRARLRDAGFVDEQGARDVFQIWEGEEWVEEGERRRVEGLEWLDEIEEWRLLAGHYCVGWGWKGEVFGEAWRGVEGGRNAEEVRVDGMG